MPTSEQASAVFPSKRVHAVAAVVCLSAARVDRPINKGVAAGSAKSSRLTVKIVFSVVSAFFFFLAFFLNRGRGKHTEINSR